MEKNKSLDKNLKMVFIGGVPRSGTTLVQTILGMSSEVYAGPEFDHLYEICKLYNNFKTGFENKRQIPFYNKEFPNKAFRKLIEEALLNQEKPKSFSVLSEKTPSNVLVFRELKELFPEAKFVLVVRNPKGSISSFRKVALRAKKYGDSVPVGVNIFSDLKLIKNYIETGSKFYFSNKEDCYLLYYENLLLNPEEEVKSLCYFVGIPFEQKMLSTNSEQALGNFIEKENPTGRAWLSLDTYQQPIISTKIDDWKKSLPTAVIELIDKHFSMNRNPILNFYDFKSQARVNKIPLLKLYVKDLGLKGIADHLTKKLKHTFRNG